MIIYPKINPVFLAMGPIELRWYGLAYVVGIVGAAFLLRKEFKNRLDLTTDDLLNVITYLILGILIGGRLGYILFYDPIYYMTHWVKCLAIWEGGMSYHGGALGAMTAVLMFAKHFRKNAWILLDLLGVGSTIGIALGRLSNFINGELYGRVSSVPWAMVFPNGGPLPRHPSQLYEAGLEGVLLFAILYTLLKRAQLKSGVLFGLYVVGYGTIRFGLEFLREPDAQIGLVWGLVSIGQMLSLCMIVAGAGLIIKRAR